MKQFTRLLANTRLRRFLWPLGALTLLGLLFAASVIFTPREIAAGQAPVPTPPAATSNVDQYFIQGLRQALSSDRLDASDRQSLQKKLAYSERLAAQRGAPSAARGPKGALLAPVPMPQPLQQDSTLPVERILPGSEGMLHTWEASVTNRWEGLYRDLPTQVFAGATPADPAQGLLIVIQYPAETGQPVRRAYLAPSRAGALTILERQGDLLRCAAADGSTLLFNLETRAFQP